jgi:tol-pal system protein YbgF
MRNLSARVDLLTTRLGLPTLGEFKEPAPGGADLQALPEEGRAIYNAALLDRDHGNDELAAQGFQEFLDRYPRSEMADDASYWLGEIAYARGDHAAALTAFLRLSDEFPEAERRPDALHKAVLSAYAIGDLDQARALLDRLKNDYPGSEQTALATAALEAD